MKLWRGAVSASPKDHIQNSQESAKSFIVVVLRSLSVQVNIILEDSVTHPERFGVGPFPGAIKKKFRCRLTPADTQSLCRVPYHPGQVQIVGSEHCWRRNELYDGESTHRISNARRLGFVYVGVRRVAHVVTIGNVT